MSNTEHPAEIRELDKVSSVERHMRQFIFLGWKYVKELIGETFEEWYRDDSPRLGAALAFYSVFSIAPLLIIVIAVAGLVFGREAAEGQMMRQIQDLVGTDGAEAIQKMLGSARAPAKGMVATVVGLFTVILGASLVLSELRSSLNLIWKASPPSGLFRGLLNEVHQRVFSLAMVLGIGFLLLVSLAINAMIAAVGSDLQRRLPLPEAVLQIGTLAIWFVVTAVLFALIYKILPEAEIAWSDVAVGSIFTSALFTIGKFLIALYLGKSGVASTYGAAGSVVIILLWIYYSSQIFFFGAEFTKVYANKYGSRLHSRLSLHPSDLSSPTLSNPIVRK